MLKTKFQIGPEDDGERMTLESFAEAQALPGHLYELAKGRVIVVEVPSPSHEYVLQALDLEVRAYQRKHPGVIELFAPGSGCVLRLPGLVSERHPDRAIYLMPQPSEERPWDFWIPHIAIEVVSKESEHRDYYEKREEYLKAGISEYWIIDPKKRRVLALARRADTWGEHRYTIGDRLRTRLLPGFVLNVACLLTPSDLKPHKRRRNGQGGR